MVIPHTVHGEIPLVDAGGDAGGVGKQELCAVIRVRVLRVAHAGLPAGAIGPRADDADVAAYVEHIALAAECFGLLRRHFGGVALAERADVDGGKRVRDTDGVVFHVQLQKGDVRVLRGLGKRFFGRHIGVLRIVRRRFARVVPERENASHHHVHLSAGQLIELLGIEQKLHQPRIHRYSFSAGHFVYRTEVVYAGILVVDIKKPVIFPEHISNFGRTVRKPFCRIACITVNIGHRVKVGEIAFPLRLDRFGGS